MDDKKIFKVSPDDCKEHNFVDLCRIFNGRSCYGTKICQKCGVEFDWQYDLPGMVVITDVKPY